MISTIVVGTDGSQTAKRAVAVAAELTQRFEATLHLVHGYNDPSGPLGSAGSSVATRWRRASEAVLEEALADPELAGVKVTSHSVPAAPAQALLDVAEAVGADLIVVGNRGLRTESASVPQAVTRSAPCHVLVAKTT